MQPLSVPIHQLEKSEDVFKSLSYADHPVSSLPVANPTKSFWIDSPGANPLAKEGSVGDLTVEADVCIIGSGITGISAAYHLSKKAGLKVVVLEARDFCRNGGHLTTAVFEAFSAQAKLYGIEQAVRGYELEEYTARAIVKIIKERDLAVDLVHGGHATLFFTEEEERQSREDFRQAKEAGIDVTGVEWFTKETMQKIHRTPYPAVKFDGYNLWPLKFVTELYHIAKRQLEGKLYLHTNTPVISISASTTPDKWDLHTPRGTITSKYVIHATNAYASHLLPFLHGPEGIIPTRGQVIAVKARSLGSVTSWDGNEGFEEPLVILGGGREAVGPGFEYYVTDDASVNEQAGEALRGFLPSVFDGVEKIEPDIEWRSTDESQTGIMGYTKSKEPFVGPLRDQGQFIAAGFSGHGMPRTFAWLLSASMIIAEMERKPWVMPTWLPDRYLTKDRL
ncbi:FAD dependent oxidoreductase-domain-containing protein [Mucidula mucida]|nr:FAD dependent oxidoreductase-domain-containing protein [Mucidula mucida]